jgi:hypothetical protein
LVRVDPDGRSHMPYSIDSDLVEAVERHANLSLNHDALLGRVRTEYPAASLRDIARAALYATTDPAPANEAMTVRLYDFALTVRRMA